MPNFLDDLHTIIIYDYGYTDLNIKNYCYKFFGLTQIGKINSPI